MDAIAYILNVATPIAELFIAFMSFAGLPSTVVLTTIMFE